MRLCLCPSYPGSEVFSWLRSSRPHRSASLSHCLPAASVFALCGPKHAQNNDSTSTLCLAWRSRLINSHRGPGMRRRGLQSPRAFQELSISPHPPISSPLRCWQCPSPAHSPSPCCCDCWKSKFSPAGTGWVWVLGTRGRPVGSALQS